MNTSHLHSLLESLRNLCEASSSSYKNAWTLLVSEAMRNENTKGLLKNLINQPTEDNYFRLLNATFRDEKAITASLDRRNWKAEPIKALQMLRGISGKVGALMLFTPDDVAKNFKFLSYADIPDEITQAIIEFFPDWDKASNAAVQLVRNVRASALLWPFIEYLAGKRQR